MNGEREARGRGFRVEGEYNPIGDNRRKMRELGIETAAGFIGAAERIELRSIVSPDSHSYEN